MHRADSYLAEVSWDIRRGRILLELNCDGPSPGVEDIVGSDAVFLRAVGLTTVFCRKVLSDQPRGVGESGLGLCLCEELGEGEVDELVVGTQLCLTRCVERHHDDCLLFVVLGHQLVPLEH